MSYDRKPPAPRPRPAFSIHDVRRSAAPALMSAPIDSANADGVVPPALKEAKPEIKASKSARALAKIRGIDLTKVKGTGQGGSIQLADVHKFSGGV